MIQLRQVQDRELVGVAEIHRPRFGGPRQGDDPRDEVVDVADRARLRPVPGHRDRLPPQRLADEVGDGAPVVRSHPGTEGVEDPGDGGVHPEGLAVGEADRLGEPLGLVVDAARPRRG